MGVSFTPGDHPTSASRSVSSTSIPGRINVTTANYSERSSSMTNTPLTSSPLTISFPRRYPIDRDRDHEDLERQPLIPSQDASRGRGRHLWPFAVAVLMVIGVGLMIGLGGWKLGQGAGEGKWPGGPG